MRPQPEKPIVVRGRILGGPVPLLCVPLTGRTRETILREASDVSKIAPDMIEIRVDFWDFVEETESALSMVREIRETVGDIPVILTCRRHEEGGWKKVTEGGKFILYIRAVEAGLVDFLDVELASGEEKIREMLSIEPSVSLIVSSHDFEKTPSRNEIISILTSEIQSGAQIAKFAAMPGCEEDVLALLSATLAARRAYPEIPLITMSMGDTGGISRIAGGFFGSDLTFARSSNASAPGQIPASAMKGFLSSLYHSQQ
ncbi:MAG: type I 3-dehydroquinate dehydratase [Synergistaceae bacterium]|nr:type I 3-dehydroquinate dehydratase [Synergistaceae bacterium]